MSSSSHKKYLVSDLVPSLSCFALSYQVGGRKEYLLPLQALTSFSCSTTGKLLTPSFRNRKFLALFISLKKKKKPLNFESFSFTSDGLIYVQLFLCKLGKNCHLFLSNTTSSTSYWPPFFLKLLPSPHHLCACHSSRRNISQMLFAFWKVMMGFTAHFCT